MSVRLSPVELADAETIQELASDPVLAETTNLPSPYPPDGARRWIEGALSGRAAGTGLVFTIRNERDEIVGVCSLIGIDQGSGSGSVGYWVGRPYWGRGYATFACRELLRIARERLGLDRVEAPVLEHNAASRRVLEKVGFECRGEVDQHPKGRVLQYECTLEESDQQSGHPTGE